MLILATARGLVHQHNEVVNRNPQWQSYVATDLTGKTMGVLGLGNLGKGIANVSHIALAIIIVSSVNVLT